MSSDDRFDDDDLQALLGQALLIDEGSIPPQAHELALVSFDLHHLDAEVAELVRDSLSTADSTVRSAEEQHRDLEYQGPGFALLLELTGDALSGQLASADAARIRLQRRDGAETVLDVDEFGSFRAQAVDGWFRVVIDTGSAVVMTEWVDPG